MDCADGRLIEWDRGAPSTDDPVLRALLSAPPEDEELDPAEVQALEAARAKRARSEAVYVTDEDVARELGG
jgi:hypothetical protein